MAWGAYPTSPASQLKSSDQSLPAALRFFGWVYLILSVVGGIVLWTQIARITGEYSWQTATSPVGAAIAVGVMMQGILAGLLLMAVASIVADVRDARISLEAMAPSPTQNAASS